VVPDFFALPIVWARRRRCPLTPMLYALIFVPACVLMLGGHCSHARVPLGEWMRETFAFERSRYDRIGHFMQGLVPAIVARELLLRHTGLQRGSWLFTVVAAVALAISASYELIEWGTAVARRGGADELPATQGDPWDTRQDMAMAWTGAMLAQLLLERWHDRQLSALRLPSR
jgi:putative membrane protein